MWVKVDGHEAVLGLSDYLQDQMGEITLLDLPDLGDVLRAKRRMGHVESEESSSPIEAPITGEVIEVNAEALENPDIVNTEPYGSGWLLRVRIEDPSEISNPNVVKVVTDSAGDALYFSRCPIPYDRDGGIIHFKHIGLYVYRREFLLQYSDLPVGPLERVERLEQLRALENGYRIRVVETEYDSLGVDTPEDLERVSTLFEAFISR